ncbi:hypothetical protein HKX42_09650 [Salinisphaera sp. USBA-960]|nr:hypothetical protein [Salifodinibacter halophilus]NNC27137.1 hypothetical protein [Salifodinibacter halophilus]
MPGFSFSRLAPIFVALAPMATVAATPSVDHLAIYPSGAAIVADSQSLDLEEGANQSRWSVIGDLQPATFWLADKNVSLTQVKPGASAPTPNDPLHRRIDKQVTLTRAKASKDTDPASNEKHGTLTAVTDDTAYVDVNGQTLRITPNSRWDISWSAPDQAAQHNSERTLELRLQSDQAGQTKPMATYQIGGLNWQASTTGEYDAANQTLTFHSLAVVHNKSKSDIHASQADLVAGDINRVGNHQPRPTTMAAAKRSRTAASKPKKLGQGYRYTLDDGLNLPAGQTRAYTIIHRNQIKATRTFKFNNGFNDQYKTPHRRHAEVRLRFKNPDQAPLPAGAFRIYAAKRPAALLGADQIANTPAGGQVDLNLGRAFDVTSTRQIIADETQNDTQRRTIAIKLRNAGANAATVKLDEHLPKQAKVTSATQPSDNTSPGNARWQFEIEAHSNASLRYTVRWPKRS